MTCYPWMHFFLSNSRICRLRQRPVLRFERPSHWGCAISHWWTSRRDRTPVTIRGVRGATFGLQGFSISVASYCQVPARDKNHMRDVIPGYGSQPEAKKDSEKSSQIEHSPKELHAK